MTEARAMDSRRDVEALYLDVQAGRVHRKADGRFWRDVLAGYGSRRRDARRCDTAAKVLLKQGRVTVAEDGTVVPVDDSSSA